MNGESVAISYRDKLAITSIVDALAAARGCQRSDILHEATRFYLNAQANRTDLTTLEKKALAGYGSS